MTARTWIDPRDEPALLLLCNGYRTDLERDFPLNAALERRRKDILYLLLDWGADPNGADVWRILRSSGSRPFSDMPPRRSRCGAIRT